MGLVLEGLIWRLLTISDVSAFSDSSTDGLWRPDADVYVFNGDELPENAFDECGNRLVVESVWHDTQSNRLLNRRASLTHIATGTGLGEAGRSFGPCRCGTFIWSWGCPCQSSTWPILTATWCINGQIGI